MDTEKIKSAVRDIIEAIGEDPDRDGLQRTPERVAQMYKDISFYSICEHHLIPFFGKVHIAYIPQNGRITGFSRMNLIKE